MSPACCRRPRRRRWPLWTDWTNCFRTPPRGPKQRPQRPLSARAGGRHFGARGNCTAGAVRGQKGSAGVDSPKTMGGVWTSALASPVSWSDRRPATRRRTGRGRCREGWSTCWRACRFSPAVSAAPEQDRRACLEQALRERIHPGQIRRPGRVGVRHPRRPGGGSRGCSSHQPWDRRLLRRDVAARRRAPIGNRHRPDRRAGDDVPRRKFRVRAMSAATGV